MAAVNSSATTALHAAGRSGARSDIGSWSESLGQEGRKLLAGLLPLTPGEFKDWQKRMAALSKVSVRDDIFTRMDSVAD
jgi:hypothetical protein